MEPTSDTRAETGGADEAEPIRDTDPTTMDDPAADAAQAEWERDAASAGSAIGDEGVEPAPLTDPDDGSAGTAGAEPLPESQGEDPLLVELGDDGEGDLSPEDA